jgi:SAM-dependent methyltransferase
MKKLLLCCGPTRPAGYVRLDANPAHDPDILAAIPPLPAEVHAQEWDVIELIHGIEHFWEWDAGLLLRQCWSVLRPGGMLVLEQPNIEAACRVFLGLDPPQYRGTLESAMWPLYGDPAHLDPGYCHKWGYTPETLSALLRDVAPWSSLRVLPQHYHAYAAGRDFRVEAVR